eukprot:7171926-Pyramimonas_sp.AAC.1
MDITFAAASKTAERGQRKHTIHQGNHNQSSQLNLETINPSTTDGNKQSIQLTVGEQMQLSNKAHPTSPTSRSLEEFHLYLKLIHRDKVQIIHGFVCLRHTGVTCHIRNSTPFAGTVKTISPAMMDRETDEIHAGFRTCNITKKQVSQLQDAAYRAHQQHRKALI